MDRILARMPRYVYKCQSCEESFTVFHGMSEDQEHCEICGAVGTVKRIPQMPSVKIMSQKAGQLVDEYIQDTKEELKREKEKLKKQEYKPS
jgi:putative FmdB family regulatory protein